MFVLYEESAILLTPLPANGKESKRLHYQIAITKNNIDIDNR